MSGFNEQLQTIIQLINDFIGATLSPSSLGISLRERDTIRRRNGISGSSESDGSDAPSLGGGGGGSNTAFARLLM